MEQKKREVLSKKIVEFLKKELPGKPFLVTLAVLDKEATKPGEKNHTETLIELSEPFSKMPFNQAKILIEVTAHGIQTLLNQTMVNIGNIVPKGKAPKEQDSQYG